MKYLIVFLIALFFANCDSIQSQKKEINFQVMKDSTHFSNGQLAYKKGDGVVKFYDYKGNLTREMNSTTRIERVYNPSVKIGLLPVDVNSTVEIAPGFLSYPDGILVPKGTKEGNLVLDIDRTDSIPKGGFGYPENLKINDFGLPTEIGLKSIVYDDLGRVVSEKYIIPSTNDIWKSVQYEYDRDGLKSSIHKGKESIDNYRQEYKSNGQGNLSKVLKIKDDTLVSVTSYVYENILLKTEKRYTYNNSQFTVDVSQFEYDSKGRCTGIVTFLVDTDTIESFDTIIEGSQDKIEEYTAFHHNKRTKKIEFDNGRVVSFKEIDNSRSKPTALISLKYAYNDKGQLIEVENLLQNSSKYFVYHNSNL